MSFNWREPYGKRGQQYFPHDARVLFGDSVSTNLSTAYSRCLLWVVVSEILSDTLSY